jgi:hypothetical protein
MRQSVCVYKVGLTQTVQKLLLGCIRKITKSDYWLRYACLTVRSSVRMKQLGSH